jgi:hypothetical protein
MALKQAMRDGPYASAEVPRLIEDEGVCRALLIASGLLRDKDARSRVLAMRAVFRKHSSHLRAIAITARKL